MVVACPHSGESVPWARAAGGRHSLPRRNRIRKALRKPRFPLRWGCRRRFLRLRLGEETSSLQSPKTSAMQSDAIFGKCVLGNFAFHRHFREIQMMTWEEITDLLITFGEKVHVIRGDNADAVSLQLVPAGWFVSIKSSGVLNMGIYEGKDNRLIGTRTIPFAELTPEFLRQEVQKTLMEQVATFLDSDALRDYLDSTGRKRRQIF